ncbi:MULTISPECIES: ribosome maturation factor RimM [Idiomarinaceae]|uniref:Ribosome maturation factor RimM n=4 Tax=Pseudidiomarina TaxID=2800384 RepID=A0A368UQ13_9GAMM|nr:MULTISPECIES: ribosome maturation factor RimM [Idiomarinaceae]MDT7524542.1 ribosome maturation factor RimM [Pseudidiomarina sp. GXY010]MDX1526462.1 ribosome maturation factor RimM [Pseudidiomarina maritima]MRJ42427.1 ribosome maturation factor RimM [Idiomarina sp. FeN1]NCU58041.1 ribosome maturation factor RimM [Idiomarina sp. FenA--70]NCU60739.1 ribosome maturation factor RimM [Idiomarina sp. FenBw--71]
MSTTSETVVLGQLGAVYGVKGWLKVQSYTDDAEAIFTYSPWQIVIQGKQQTVTVEEWRRHNKGLIAKLAGIEDRDQAHLMTGADIIIPAEQLPELPADEFYWRDLIGMTVVNTDGYNMGVVDQIMATASNDVMVVKANNNDAFGRTERLIPFIQSQYVQSVDKTAQRIIVDWPSDF